MQLRRALVLLVLALAGCGGEAATPGKAAPDTSYARDGEIVAASGLTLADFPKGWTAEEPESTDDGLCTRTEATERKAVMSPLREFSRTEVDGYLSRVYVFPDEAAAEEAFAVFADVKSL